MKLPRWTIGRLMILVAFVAIAADCGRLACLSGQYRRKALVLRFHGRWPGPSAGSGTGTESEGARAGRDRRVAWAMALSTKYDRLADRPWLSVEPDPPEPD